MNVLGIALSGMQAAQAKLDAAAQNIANLDTPGYQPVRADLVELSTGGVGVAGISKDPNARPGVDLATETINLTRAQILYSANAAVLKVGKQMTGTLLDILDHDRSHRRG